MWVKFLSLFWLILYSNNHLNINFGVVIFFWAVLFMKNLSKINFISCIEVVESEDICHDQNYVKKQFSEYLLLYPYYSYATVISNQTVWYDKNCVCWIDLKRSYFEKPCLARYMKPLNFCSLVILVIVISIYWHNLSSLSNKTSSYLKLPVYSSFRPPPYAHLVLCFFSKKLKFAFQRMNC